VSVNLELGTRRFDYLEVPGTAGERRFVSNPLIGPPRPRTSKIPIMRVKGSSEGPNLCIIAGTHACEYPAIDAAIKVYRQTDPLKLTGQLVIVPVVNVAAFWTRTPYINPSDGVDIGATYGADGNSISYLIGKALVESVFAKADYIVDLHGGDVLEDIVPHAGYTKIGNRKVDAASEMLARTYGTKYVFERLVKGAFERSGIAVPRTLAEAGREGKLEDEYSAIHIKGLTNIMKSLNMIDGEPEVPSDQVVVHGRYEIFAGKAGIFYPATELGAQIKKGDVLGEIRDLEGKIVEEIIAPRDGVVMLMMTNPVKHPDDLIFKCWLA